MGRVAVVTGATSGIGRAIAIALARSGAELCLVGRNAERLAEIVMEAQKFVPAKGFQIDLTIDANLQPLGDYLDRQVGRLDILVHSAGILYEEPLEEGRLDHLDEQFAINVRAPYALTKALVPFLVKAAGQVVFINSSAGLSVVRPEIGQYAATKHALRALAESLRAELNPQGVKVLSMYLGRTATALQERLARNAARPYPAEKLLQPEDVATMLLAALALPATAEVTDISIRPMVKWQ